MRSSCNTTSRSRTNTDSVIDAHRRFMRTNSMNNSASSCAAAASVTYVVASYVVIALYDLAVPSSFAVIDCAPTTCSNIRCSTRCATPSCPTGSSAAPTA